MFVSLKSLTYRIISNPITGFADDLAPVRRGFRTGTVKRCRFSGHCERFDGGSCG